MPERELVFSGVCGVDGTPAFPPLTIEEAAAAARRAWKRLPSRHEEEILGPVPPEETGDLSRAGWAVVLPSDDPDAGSTLKALNPLLELRKEQAGPLFQILKGELGHRPSESHEGFLERFEVGSQDPDPEKLPANLLLVANPNRIPFEFQALLDQWYNVGRLDLPGPAEIEAYARSVVSHEASLPDTSCQLAFFGTRHEGAADKAPRLAQDHLLDPLAEDLEREQRAFRIRREFSIESIHGPEATKEALGGLLGKGTRPDILLAAAHGTVFNRRDPDQSRKQGGLVTSDWSGKGKPGESAFGAADVGPEDDMRGSVGFFFSCFGGGTPLHDQFIRPDQVDGLPIAKEPFVAGLPKALMGRERGPLAVIGHVERVWGLSFLSGKQGSQTGLFLLFLRYLIEGKTVGQAFHPFCRYHGSSAARLASHFNVDTFGPTHTGVAAAAPTPDDDEELAERWMVYNDAKGWILLGDPAVRLRKPV